MRSIGKAPPARVAQPWVLDTEQIHAALLDNPDGLNRTQLRDLFHRNRPGKRVEEALAALTRTGRARSERVLTGGRPAELWHARQPHHSPTR